MPVVGSIRREGGNVSRMTTRIFAGIVLAAIAIGLGCSGGERVGRDAPQLGPAGAFGFFVLKAAGGQAVSWASGRALDHFWRDGGQAMNPELETVQASLKEIRDDIGVLQSQLRDIRTVVSEIKFALDHSSVSPHKEKIDVWWGTYGEWLGIHRADGSIRDEIVYQPTTADWEDIASDAHDTGIRYSVTTIGQIATEGSRAHNTPPLLDALVTKLLNESNADLARKYDALERFFLDLVSYQSQGFILYAEAWNALDVDGVQPPMQTPESYLAHDLKPSLKRQALEFLRCAERLLCAQINLAADAGPDGSGRMEVPDRWLYSASEVPPEHLRVFPEYGPELLKRATLTTLKTLSYVDDDFVNLREGREIFVVHVIGDPINVKAPPAGYLGEYMSIPGNAAFNAAFVNRDGDHVRSFAPPAEFRDAHADGLRTGDGYIQFNRKRMGMYGGSKKRLYVEFREATSIDAAAYEVSGARPGGWNTTDYEIVPPTSELGGDTISFGHALYSARPIGSYLGFARSVQDLQLVDVNSYKDYAQVVRRVLPDFGPQIAKRSMSDWSSSSCSFSWTTGKHTCSARWLYQYGLKCHLTYSGTGAFTMKLRPAVLVDRLPKMKDYDRVEIDGHRLDRRVSTADGHLHTLSSGERALHFTESERFKSITVHVISESSSGVGCHNDFVQNQQMSLQSLSIVR